MEIPQENEGDQLNAADRFFSCIKRNRHRLLIGMIAFVVLAVIVFAGTMQKNGKGIQTLFKPSIGTATFSVEPEMTSPAGIETSSPFLLKSSENLSEREIEKIVHFIPETKFSVTKKKVSYSGNVVHAADGKEGEQLPYAYELKAQASLEDGKVYQVAIDDTTVANRQYSWAFQTKAPFKVLTTTPAQHATEVLLNSGIEINFNRDRIENFEKNFHISPSVKGTFKTRGKKNCFCSGRTCESDGVYGNNWKRRG